MSLEVKTKSVSFAANIIIDDKCSKQWRQIQEQKANQQPTGQLDIEEHLAAAEDAQQQRKERRQQIVQSAQIEQRLQSLPTSLLPGQVKKKLLRLQRIKQRQTTS